jgi:citrate lyase gamma subunit
MQKMNAGIWLGIVGGIIGLLVGVSSVIMTGGSVGIYIAAGMLFFFGGMFYLFYRVFFKDMINTSRLQKTGISGTARILEVRDTGITINRSPQVKLMLEIKNSLGQRYTASCRALVSRINPRAFVPGMEVPVKIDPKNEMNIALDFSSAKQSDYTINTSVPATNITLLHTDISQLQKENEAILLSGKPARAIIKKIIPLGASAAIGLQLVEIELEVLPESYPAFSGKAKGLFSETAMNNYQPGNMIQVKYDLYDNSKVVVNA